LVQSTASQDRRLHGRDIFGRSLLRGLPFITNQPPPSAPTWSAP
jgi:hypothetical protein